MSFIQNIVLGFAGIGILIGWFQGNTNAIIIFGVILICLFLSCILDAVNKLNK